MHSPIIRQWVKEVGGGAFVLHTMGADK